MPNKPPVDLTAFDAALGAVVASGWQDDARTRPDAGLPAPATTAPAAGQPYYPPVPTREEVPELPPDEDGEPRRPAQRMLDIGLLSDFVTGARSAQDTATQAGVTLDELHSALATTLAQADPKELAKAMGLQISATQLKAGAVFNALLADVLEDIRLGRAKTDLKLELMKLLGRIGRLEPKEEKNAGAGAFQVVIDMGGVRAAPPPVTVIESN
jgi:hypothetical protein